MTVHDALDAVRHEFEAMHELDLVQVAKDMNVDVVGLSREELIDKLMALEEHAAFH